MIVKDELRRMWKESVVSYSMIQHPNTPEVTEKFHGRQQ
jgi:hypothetical protein